MMFKHPSQLKKPRFTSSREVDPPPSPGEYKTVSDRDRVYRIPPLKNHGYGPENISLISIRIYIKC